MKKKAQCGRPPGQIPKHLMRSHKINISLCPRDVKALDYIADELEASHSYALRMSLKTWQNKKTRKAHPNALMNEKFVKAYLFGINDAENESLEELRHNTALTRMKIVRSGIWTLYETLKEMNDDA